MERSESLNELAAALSLAQAEIEDAEKVRQNPHLKSRYADLGAVWDACKPALTKHGLSIAQFCEPAPEGQLMLTTMLLHKSGQFLAGTALIPMVKADPQAYGSSLTYARRYGLAAMVGVCPDSDDDGNAGSGREQRPAQRPTGQERAHQAVQNSERPQSTTMNQPSQAEPQTDLLMSGEAPCSECHAPAGKPHAKKCSWSSEAGAGSAYRAGM